MFQQIRAFIVSEHRTKQFFYSQRSNGNLSQQVRRVRRSAMQLNSRTANASSSPSPTLGERVGESGPVLSGAVRSLDRWAVHGKVFSFAKALTSLKIIYLIATLSVVLPAWAADSFNWDTKRNRVTADIQFRKLDRLLEQVAEKTGWEIFIEPGTTHDVSAKFKNLPPNEALRLLLGDLNFALVPSTNRNSTLYVFRTTRQNATQAVRTKPASERGKIIPNELIVRLKPGANIDELARRLGAKVIGRIAGLNAYRLQFDSADAANSAREKLIENPDVASVDNNY